MSKDINKNKGVNKNQDIFDEDYFVDSEIDDDYWFDADDDEYDEEDKYESEEDDEYEEDEYESEDDDEYEEDEYESEEDEYESEDDEEVDDSNAEVEIMDMEDDDNMPKGKKKQKSKKVKNNANTGKVKKDKKKKIGIVFGAIVAGFGVVYLGISFFFINHFYINTEINDHDFSGKTVEAVESYMKNKVAAYTLNIKDKDNNSYLIDGKSIDLVYTEGDEIEDALEKQNPFAWPKAFVKPDSFETKIAVTYDEQKLNAELQNLEVLKVEQVEPVSAHPVFDGEKFVVEPEVVGTTVDLEVFEKVIKEDIVNFSSELNMLEHGCYKLPKYVKDSPEVQTACDNMNKYLNASITYSMDEPVVVDKSVISNWLKVDDNMNVTFDENAVREWLRAFGEKYDTVGKTRTITTPWGKTAEVSGGTYGWGVDEEAEFKALVNSIKNGEVITKDPAYCPGQTAASHGPQDWGSTYAEVDLSAQHMWYIENGNVVVESDVVTGEPIPAKETTAGVFYILEKASPKTLVGDIKPETGKPEYETPVTYWMRITWSGIGFHDASWQPAFGGNLYAEGRGSHGCVNMPYDAAGALYNAMPEGTPVIVHY